VGFEKSQHSVTHDSLRYINILTYLLTYKVQDQGLRLRPRPETKRPRPIKTKTKT